MKISIYHQKNFFNLLVLAISFIFGYNISCVFILYEDVCIHMCSNIKIYIKLKRSRSMGINVKLQVFEGPLDLLLHLIDKNKVNIYDIPIAMITEQYMEYVNQMDKEDLNVVSEFLVMAATLLDIKSRMLLPKEVNEEGEEEDHNANGH